MEFEPISEDRPIIIAGPCSAESEEQVMITAEGLKSAGVGIYRAGLWKPRTRPGNFEGVGTMGLPWLKRVKEEFGMLTATEIANRYHAENAIDAGVDILWIGARTTANPFAMQEIADVVAEKDAHIPVLVKNPVSPDIELWIGALQRLYNAGVRKLGAIHRGFSVYGHHLYRNQPQWHIALELRRRMPQLPILCDPSHIGGKREMIAPLSQQAMDMGFDGLIVESHCNPEAAWSDSAQQVTPQRLKEIIEGLQLRNAADTSEDMVALRREIDLVDSELLDVLNRRMKICREIGMYKQSRAIPVVQPGRYDDVLTSRIKAAGEMDMDEEFIGKIMSAIHEESVRQQLSGKLVRGMKRDEEG